MTRLHDMSRIVTTPEHAVAHDLARHELRVQAVTVGVADVALAVLQPGPGVVTLSVTCHASRGTCTRRGRPPRRGSWWCRCPAAPR